MGVLGDIKTKTPWIKNYLGRVIEDVATHVHSIEKGAKRIRKRVGIRVTALNLNFETFPNQLDAFMGKGKRNVQQSSGMIAEAEDATAQKP